MKTFIICSLVFIFSFEAVYTQDNWKLQRDKNGIKVYTQVVENSSLKAFKGITEIDAEMETLVAVCKDVMAFPEWQSTTKTAQLLDTEGETGQIHYLEFPAPWPLSNRDAITQFVYSFDSSSQSVHVKMLCLPDYLPEKEDIVRIKKSNGYYLFEPQNNGKIKVIYSAHGEPGGKIPAWLANSTVVDTPYHTLLNLKEQVKKEKYRGKTYGFIEN